MICASMIIITHLTNTMKNASLLRYYCYIITSIIFIKPLHTGMN